MKPSIAIVGCGTVGTALGKLLAGAGYPITGVATTRLETARRAAAAMGAERFSDSPWKISRDAQVIFITTPDDAIRPTCEEMARRHGFKSAQVVIHCSGALSSHILASARDSGAVAATIHPLQSFASVDQAETLVPGSYCAVEGDPEALPLIRTLVEDLGGILMEISPEGKTLYHAAAVVASNYLVALIHLAQELNGTAGLSPKVSFEALLPLIQGTLANIGAKGIPEALTGPIARGDVDTVATHLKAIEARAPDLLALYRSLGRHTIDLAKAKGTLNDKAAEKLTALLVSQESMDAD